MDIKKKSIKMLTPLDFTNKYTKFNVGLLSFIIDAVYDDFFPWAVQSITTFKSICNLNSYVDQEKLQLFTI